MEWTINWQAAYAAYDAHKTACLQCKVARDNYRTQHMCPDGKDLLKSWRDLFEAASQHLDRKK